MYYATVRLPVDISGDNLARAIEVVVNRLTGQGEFSFRMQEPPGERSIYYVGVEGPDLERSFAVTINPNYITPISRTVSYDAGNRIWIGNYDWKNGRAVHPANIQQAQDFAIEFMRILEEVFK